MKLRPTIFLSGVSSEFASFRDAAEIEIQKKGCFAENQSSFGVDYRTIEQMLRRKLHDADAVIHIVGFRLGAEPKDRPAGKPRRSYTQMEYDIAREMEKPVYVFLSSDASVRDAPTSEEQPEDAEATALQLAHRQTIKSTNNLRYTFKDKNELRQLAAQIDQVAQADFRVDISRIIEYAPTELIGREDELTVLNDAWLKVCRAESRRPHILTLVALGGEGKTSLVAKWLADLAYQHWPGCDSAFAWSFYNQGTREQYAASSDLFLKEAITFFGNEADKEFAASSAGAPEKGQRLARIISQRRALLILDGLEPLQYAPTSPTPGELKDGGIADLLKALAADSDGLCIVTTRYSLPNLKAYWQTTAPEITLTRLSRAAGVHLLKNLGVNGSTKEVETLVEDVKGHALTLNLLGTYLRDAHGGDIRRRDLIKLEEADAEEGGHAFRVIEAYERAFEDEGEKGQRALAILRLLGLFDRPVSAGCLAALLEEPTIPSLTDSLIGLSEAQRNLVLKRLEDARLIIVNREASAGLVSLDAHPLLREYFALELRTEMPETWRAAHHRLYEYLCAATDDKEEPTLKDIEPLYQAVAHGCQAGLQDETCFKVYYVRILRGPQHYTWHKLGAYSSELGAQACFFDTPWTRLSSGLSERSKAFLLNETAYCLRALGRLKEALDPMRAGLPLDLKLEDWKNAGARGANLSQLELTLGQVSRSLIDGEQSVVHADQSKDAFWRVMTRCAYADALHHAGRRVEAQASFSEAEQIQREQPNVNDLLYGLAGFQYCNLLLADSERAAWQRTLGLQNLFQIPAKTKFTQLQEALELVYERATASLNIDFNLTGNLAHIALDRFILGRIAFATALLSSKGLPANSPADSELTAIIDETVKAFRRCGVLEEVPRGLLARAWLRFLIGARTGPESAQEDLDEAWEIAERGPMRLIMADIHLYRARLFFREERYPWESARKDLEEAERLINECGYHRRDEELADAKRVILGQSV